MICILSQSQLELSTEFVGRWLNLWRVPHVRLNADDIDTGRGGISVRDGHLELELRAGRRTIRSSDITTVWYRRWSLVDPMKASGLDPIGEPAHRDYNILAWTVQHARERRAISRAIFGALAHAQWFNRPDRCEIGKLEMLAHAESVGLDVPATLITSDQKEALRFAARHPEIITKCIGDLFFFRVGSSTSIAGTSLVPREMLTREGSWAGGLPNLFQERLHKQFELRVTCIDEKVFTAAYLYNGEADAGIVDGRLRQFRAFPFRLDDATQDKLRALMKLAGLDMAAIDMVKTTDGRLVFLEANPTGQFCGEEGSCNFPLHKTVAESLVRRYRHAS